MKPEQLYQHLTELAEKMGITVWEQNFRATGVKAKSGLCKIEGKQVFIMDKHQSMQNKIEILSTCLGELPHENIYIIPAVREFIKKFT